MNQVRAAFATEDDEINTQIIDRLTAFGIIRGESLGGRRELVSKLPQCRRENCRPTGYPDWPGARDWYTLGLSLPIHIWNRTKSN